MAPKARSTMPPPEKILAMWIVYDHPTDHPDVFVARKWWISPAGQFPTDEMLACADLDGLREMLPPHLTCLPRDPADAPKIVEIWF